MDAFKIDSSKTTTRIEQVAFRYFLEKGYEATNLRMISDEVGIKAASIYFYYRSKSDLFFQIINGVFQRQLDVSVQSVNKLEHPEPLEQLYVMFRDKILDGMNNSSEYKFRLRYRMFPATELTVEIREIYEKWDLLDFEVYKPVLQGLIHNSGTYSERNVKSIYHQYIRVLYSILYERIISGIAIKEDEIRTLWQHYVHTVLMESITR